MSGGKGFCLLRVKTHREDMSAAVTMVKKEVEGCGKTGGFVGIQSWPETLGPTTQNSVIPYRLIKTFELQFSYLEKKCNKSNLVCRAIV